MNDKSIKNRNGTVYLFRKSLILKLFNHHRKIFMKIFAIIFIITIPFTVLTAGGNLTVTNVTPPPQSTNFLPSVELVIDFSNSLNVSTFNDTTFQVWGRWSGVHKGNIVFYNNNSSLLFTSNENYFYGELVTVSLSKGIKDEQGNSLSHGYSWSFWTRTISGTMNLTRTGNISVRQQGENWIQTYGTYAGDLDGDGWSDFIVPNEIAADVRVFMNDQLGGYSDFNVYPITNGSRPSTNEGFDYNLDGLMDFAVGNSTNNFVTVFSGDGTGGFSGQQNYQVGDGVRGLVILDANGDGFSDIVTANRTGSNVSVLLNNRDGTFILDTTFDAGINGETAAATADVNGDGIMDLFIGAINSDHVALFLGDGDGGFVFSDEVVSGNGPWMVVAGDVNGDRIPDVVCANSSANSVSIILCDSLGNLSSPVTYPVGSFPLSVDLGDVDGDGDLDLATSNFSSANFTLYENDGTGVFINRNDLPSNQAGSCCVFHDRDNDGDMDMTGIDEIEDLIIFFENEGPTEVEQGSIPQKFYLSQNYPNPFNPGTSMQFAIGSRYFVTLKVYDILGNEIITLVKEDKQPGVYVVNFDGRNLPSGIYFYSLRAGNFSETKKMILLK